MTPSGPPLLDLHDLGLRQTGNETWARGISRALFELDGPGSYDIAVSPAVPESDLARLPARRVTTVADSSTRRLAWDLPRAARAGRNSALLVQYTAPVTSVPTVVMVHDLSFEDPRAAEWLPLSARLRYRATIRASVRRAAHVLTVSEFTKRDLMERYGLASDRISVAPNAVDPDFAALLDAEPEQRDGPPTVLCVGNVLPRKNLVVVARAVHALRSRGEDVRLRIVGEVHPTGRRDAQEISRLLGDAVTFTGYVSRRQLAREYRSAHVLAFPSLFEGFGIPVLEAMRAGVPVVVSDRGALPEVAGSAALIADASDPLTWVESVKLALGTRWLSLRGEGTVRGESFGWSRSGAVVSKAIAGLV